MPKITQCFKAYSEIIAMQVCENDTIAVATSQSGILTLEKERCKTVSNILPEQINEGTTLTAFSRDAKFIAIVKSNRIEILHLQTRKVTKTITVDDPKIDIISFDPSSTYLIVGTNKGRVLQYRYNSEKPISRLCSFPYYFPGEQILKIKDNFVSAFAFFDEYLACSGYGGSINVINLHTRANKQVITRSRVKIKSLCFIDKNTLISGNEDGVLEIISLQDISKIKRMNTPFIKIRNIISMPNKDYILVSSNKSFISLINIKLLKVVNDKYISFSHSIQTIILKDKENILAILKDYSVMSVELINTKTLKSLIDNDRIIEAYKLIMKAPMLKASKEYHELGEKYNKYMIKIINYLINDDESTAKEVATMLKSIPSKKDDIDLIFSAFKHYKKFQYYFHQQNYPLAYSMCEKYPALKHTIEYKSMEKFWKKSFLDAEKEILLNNTESARVILSEYMTISSKKPLIKFLLHKNRELINFLKAIDNKEFEKVTLLTKVNEEFAHLDYYKALNHELNDNLQETKDLIQVGNIQLAKVLIEKLKTNPKYEKQAIELHQECEDVQQLQDAYDAGDYFLCYELLDSNQNLHNVELAIHLEKLWKKRVGNCEIFALKGDIKSIEKHLGVLMKLSSRHEKIGELMRITYQRKINCQINKKSYKEAKEYIMHYSNLYGLDKEINDIIKLYVKSSKSKIELTNSQVRRKPRDFWLYI